MAWISVEIDGVFYETISYASRSIGEKFTTIRHRCFSNNWANYKIVPFRITHTEKTCTKCGKTKSLDKFSKNKKKRDGRGAWCAECYSKYQKKYRVGHKKESAEYRVKNLEREKERRLIDREKERKRERERLANDPILRLNRNISRVVNKSLHDEKNGRPWEKLVGYDINSLKKHLESLFTEGMSWENYGKGEGKWNIDHIIPISLWNITSAKCKGFRMCWALENLRPMWGKDNLSKRDLLFY